MDKRIEQYLDEIIEIWQQDVVDSFGYWDCYSKELTPIEKLMFFSLQYYCKDFPIHKQFPIGKYFADFMVDASSYMDGIPWKCHVVIECDGHDFHQKTKQQAAHDKVRDRFIAKSGFHVLRFTGSEIWKDPSKCGEEVQSFICDMANNEYDRRPPKAKP